MPSDPFSLFDDWDRYPLRNAMAQIPDNDLQVPRICVVIHLYYTDLWRDFDLALQSMKWPFDLVITLNQEDGDLCASISKSYPGTIFHVRPNLGRDVAPFLWLLGQGAFDGYDLVCKMHAKKSAKQGAETLVGRLWRRRAILDLIGSSERVEKIIGAFEADPSIGMAGSTALHLPTPANHDPSGIPSLNNRKQIAKQCGFERCNNPAQFYAGTMFWVRPQVLEPVRHLGLEKSMSLGTGSGDTSEMEYAMERFFGDLVTAQGYQFLDA
ncbi:MAG: rhamnan synthesis F family protein [Rhizobiaceae bacterium]